MNGDARLAKDLRLAWTLIGLAPVLLALATWSPDGPAGPLIIWMRFLSPPVLAIEIAIVAIALVHGLRPGAMIAALPVLARIAAILLPLVVIVGLLIADDRANALLRMPITLLHFMFGLAVAHLAAIDPVRSGLWRAIVGGVMGYLLLALLYVLAIPDWAAHEWQRFGLAVTNIRHSGFIAAGGAAVAIGLFATARTPRASGAALLAAIAALGFVIWSGSRGGVVALAAGAGVSLLATPMRTGLRLALGTGAAIALGVVAALPLPAPGPLYGLDRIETAVDAPDLSSGRLTLWRGTIAEIAARPVLGHGEGQFFDRPPAIRQFHHPHNIGLQLLFQWGAIGFIVVGLLGTLLWLRMLRTTRASPDRLLPGFLLANVLLAYSLYDGVLFFVMPAMLLVTACAAVAAGVASRAEDRYLARR